MNARYARIHAASAIPMESVCSVFLPFSCIILSAIRIVQ
jgi:hypothetical protein